MTEKAPQTPEELQALLDKLGIKPGEWGEKEARQVPSKLMEGQREGLVRLRDTLQGLVDSDQKTLAGMREQLTRMKYGGGI